MYIMFSAAGIKMLNCNALAFWVKILEDSILKYFSYFFFQEIGFRRQFAWNVKSCLWKKNKKSHQFVVCWISPESGKG